MLPISERCSRRSGEFREAMEEDVSELEDAEGEEEEEEEDGTC